MDEISKFRSNFYLLLVFSAIGLFLGGGCASSPKKTLKPYVPVKTSSGPAAPELTSEERIKLKITQLRQQLAKAKYDWKLYCQLGDCYMELNHPHQASLLYEQALAVYPVDRIIKEEKRQADYIAAQIQAEKRRQQKLREAQQHEAEQQLLMGMLGAMSSMPANNVSSMAMQQQLSATSSLMQSTSAYQSGLLRAEAGSIMGPNQEIVSSLPERRDLATIWIKLGCAYVADNEYERALPAFSQGRQYDPSRIDALWYAARAYFFQGQYNQAINFALQYQTLTCEGNSAEPMLLIYDAFRNLGMAREAEAAFKAEIASFAAAAKGNPGNAAVWNTLGNIYIGANRYDEAAKAYGEVLKIQPKNEQALQGLAVCCIALKQVDKMREVLSALQAGPGASRENAYTIGRLCEELGEEGQALASFNRCVEWFRQSSQKAPAYVFVAQAATGGADAAVDGILNVISEDPCAQYDYLNYYLLALAYEKQGKRPDLAIDALRQCIEDNPAFLPAVNALNRLTARYAATAAATIAKSDAALQKGDKAAAVILRAAAWAIMPDGADRLKVLEDINRLAKDVAVPADRDASAAWLRGNAILKRAKVPADIERARHEYHRAFTMMPWNTALLLNLSSCQALVGRQDLSMRDLQLYLRLNPNQKDNERVTQLHDFEQQRKVAERQWQNIYRRY